MKLLFLVLSSILLTLVAPEEQFYRSRRDKVSGNVFIEKSNKGAELYENFDHIRKIDSSHDNLLVSLGDVVQHHAQMNRTTVITKLRFPQESATADAVKQCLRYLNGSYVHLQLLVNESILLQPLINSPSIDMSNITCGCRIQTAKMYNVKITCTKFELSNYEKLELRNLRENQTINNTFVYGSEHSAEDVSFTSTSNFAEVVFSSEDEEYHDSCFECRAVAVRDVRRMTWVSQHYTWPGRDERSREFNDMGERLPTIQNPEELAITIDYDQSTSTRIVYVIKDSLESLVTPPLSSVGSSTRTSRASAYTSSGTYSSMAEDSTETIESRNKTGKGETKPQIVKITKTEEFDKSEVSKSETNEREESGNENSLNTKFAASPVQRSRNFTTNTVETKESNTKSETSRQMYINSSGERNEDENITESSSSSENSTVVKSSHSVEKDSPITETPDL